MAPINEEETDSPFCCHRLGVMLCPSRHPSLRKPYFIPVRVVKKEVPVAPRLVLGRVFDRGASSFEKVEKIIDIVEMVADKDSLPFVLDGVEILVFEVMKDQRRVAEHHQRDCGSVILDKGEVEPVTVKGDRSLKVGHVEKDVFETAMHIELESKKVGQQI